MSETETNFPLTHNGQIHVLLGKILAELPAIGKTDFNEQQKFHFRGHDQVLNALNPLLAKHGVFVTPQVLERVAAQRQTRSGGIMYEVNLHVRYTFFAPDGSSVFAEAWGEGTDSGDKATNKAMTMAMKNVLNQVFVINTEEGARNDTDRNSDPETVAPAPAPESQRAPTEAEVEKFNGVLKELIDGGAITEKQVLAAARQDVPLEELANVLTAEDLEELTDRLERFKKNLAVPS